MSQPMCQSPSAVLDGGGLALEGTRFSVWPAGGAARVRATKPPTAPRVKCIADSDAGGTELSPSMMRMSMGMDAPWWMMLEWDGCEGRRLKVSERDDIHRSHAAMRFLRYAVDGAAVASLNNVVYESSTM